MQERVLYQDPHGVMITTARAVIGHRTYAVGQVNSISGHMVKPNRLVPISMVVVGFLLLGIFALTLAVGAAGGRGGWLVCGLTGVVLALLPIGIGGFLLLTRKPLYAIYIYTTGGQQEALSTADQSYADRVLAALHEALALRG